MCYTARENVQNVCVLTNFKYRSKSANFGRFLWLDSTNQIDSFSIELGVSRHKFRVPRCLNLNKNVMFQGPLEIKVAESGHNRTVLNLVFAEKKLWGIFLPLFPESVVQKFNH